MEQQMHSFVINIKKEIPDSPDANNYFPNAEPITSSSSNSNIPFAEQNPQHSAQPSHRKIKPPRASIANGNFGVAKIGLGKQKGSILMYDSKKHPGRAYRFRGYNKKEDGDAKKYLCIDCFLVKREATRKKATPCTKPVPFIYVVGTTIVTDPDNPLSSHFCEGYAKSFHPKLTVAKSFAFPRRRGRPPGSTRKFVDARMAWSKKTGKGPELFPINKESEDKSQKALKKSSGKLDQIISNLQQKTHLEETTNNSNLSIEFFEKMPVPMAENDFPTTSWGSADVADGNGAAASKMIGEMENLTNIQIDKRHDFYYKVRVNWDHYVVDEKNLEVLVENGFVVVKGNYKEESPDGFVYRNFSYGKKIPDNIDIEKMSTELDDQGFIHITGKKKADKIVLPIKKFSGRF